VLFNGKNVSLNNLYSMLMRNGQIHDRITNQAAEAFFQIFYISE